MRPSRSILDRKFRYVPSVATSVTETWKRFGWRPMNETPRMRPLDHAKQRTRAALAAAFEDIVCV
ncbi:MAG: hypothetical protein ACXWUB_06710 [Burkholderiales bacterium]